MHVPTLQIIPQRTLMDCAVACLAMLCEVEYEDALMAFTHNVCAKGATVRQIQAAAKRLGRTLHWSRHVQDLETETGILNVASDKWKVDHVVILKEGQVLDTDFTLWDVDVFMAAYKVTAGGIFTLREDKR